MCAVRGGGSEAVEAQVEKLGLTPANMICAGQIVAAGTAAQLAELTADMLVFSSGSRHTIWTGDWSSDVCSSDLRLRRGERGRRSEIRQASSTRSEARRSRRSEERRVGKECRSRWSPYH